MADRLLTPVILLSFPEGVLIPDCLRTAYAVSRRLQLGVTVILSEQEYLVWPWMDLEQVLSMWDADQALSASQSRRLPCGVVQIGFEAEHGMEHCLRSMWAYANRMGLGLLYERDGQEYLVQPGQPIEDVLGQYDTGLAESVKAHVGEHHG